MKMNKDTHVDMMAGDQGFLHRGIFIHFVRMMDIKGVYKFGLNTDPAISFDQGGLFHGTSTEICP